jgi:hypothetical protein
LVEHLTGDSGDQIALLVEHLTGDSGGQIAQLVARASDWRFRY